MEIKTKEMISFQIEKTELETFRNYCDKQGITLSSAIRLSMKRTLEEGITIPGDTNVD